MKKFLKIVFIVGLISYLYLRTREDEIFSSDWYYSGATWSPYIPTPYLDGVDVDQVDGSVVWAEDER